MKQGLFIFILIVVTASLGWVIPQLPPLQPLIIIVGIMVFLTTLVRTDFGLVILILSMLLSPELKVAGIAGVHYRSVVVRVDDILLIAVFIAWVVKIAVRKEWGLLRQTPLNLPIVIYLLICLLSTAIGIMDGGVSPTISFFYFLKYIEYFIVYFMFTNNIRTRKQIRSFMIAFFITALIVCCYGIYQIPQATGYRVSTPFEGGEGESNTLAGYLVLVFGVCGGFLLYSNSTARRWLLAGLVCLGIPPFLYTLSRGGYVAFICMFLALTTLTKKKKILLIWLLCAFIVFAPIILPQRVIERVEDTFVPAKELHVFGITLRLETSAAQRIEVWQWIFGLWQEKPIIGYGVTGVGFVDNQYARVLGEVGAVGFTIFIWLLVGIYRNAFGVFKTVEDDYYKGLALGFLAGFAGLCAHAFTGNIFIIVRIMEPFWFLTACVITLPYLPAQHEPTQAGLSAQRTEEENFLLPEY